MTMGKIWANHRVFQTRDDVLSGDTQRMCRVNDRFKCDNASTNAKRYMRVISKRYRRVLAVSRCM
jgi:hypothetical protein